MDNAIVAQSVALGEPVQLVDILELAAATRTLFNSVTIVSREPDSRVDQCLRLWGEVRKVFEDLRAQWENVPSEDGAIMFHKAQLNRLSELAASRIDLYTITEAERRKYIELKADGTRSNSPREKSNEQSDEQSAHVYSATRA